MAPVFSHATVTITPVNGGDKISEADKHIYYGAITDSDQTLNLALFDGPEDRYFPVNIAKTQDMEDGSSYPNRLLFDVTSTGSKSDGKQVVLTVTIGGDSGARAIPISSVGDAYQQCDANTCQDVHQDLTGFAGIRYFAVKYKPGERLRIGIYPAEACLSYDIESSKGAGCTGANVTPPTSGAGGEAAEMSLTFSIGSAEGTGPATGTAQESATATLHFQVDQPKFICPDLRDVYAPGDGEIVLKSDGFKVLSGRAPANQLLVLGNEGADPDLSAKFATGNTIFTRVPVAGEHSITGFTNATAAGEHLHNVSFMLRDAAGMLAAPDAGTCKLSGVQTASIDSFLQKGNCFIATAAFRSTDAAPVELLREFRDRVLLRVPAGRTLVRIYYKHSPGAARWLMENPVFRGPVLLGLTPLELGAWLLLNPARLFAIFLFGVAAALGAARIVRRESA